MKYQHWLIWIVLTVFLAGCGGRGAAPTPDAQATINAAVAATATGEAAVQATIQAGVAATVSAMPTWTPQPTATPSPEMLEKSEEELAAEAEEAVSQVNRSIEDTSAATTEATSDDTLTQAEVEAIETYVYYTYTYLDEAEALLAAYDDLYGELASESIAAIYALEAELAALTNSIDSINATLQEINTTLEAGQALASETIQQLETVVQNASTKAQQAQTAFETYQNELSGKIEARQQAILEMKPSQMPTDLKSTLQRGFDYLDAVTEAFGDKKITQAELGKIAGLGSSFSAGANQFGGDSLKGLANKVSGPQGITANLAGGQYTQARGGLANLESGLGKRPGRP